MTFPGRSGRGVRFAVISFGFGGSALGLLLGCGGAGGGSGSNTFVPPPPAVTTNPNVTAKSVYATNGDTSTVDVYAANQSGAVSTTATISVGAHLPPQGIAADASGNLYVGVDTTTGGQVSVFASGALTPSRTIILPNPGAPTSNQVSSMTTDSLGNLYVATSSTGGTSSVGAIYVYAPGATGSAAPLRTIAGAATTLFTGAGTTGISQIAMDSKDNLYVAQGGYGPNGNVVMFPAGANGNVAPTLITSSTYSPTGVTLDAQDNIYISQGEIGTHTVDYLGKYPTAIYVFAKGSVAGATPTRTITGSSTGMFISLYNIHVDSAGNIFVEQNGQGSSQFLVYSATANGNAPPSSTLTPNRGLTVDTQFYLK